MSKCKNIAMCSFGKDSIALLYTMKEHNIPIDEIVYCKIMFDNETSAELPKHEKWIEEYAIPKIEKEFGVNVTTIIPKKTYKDYFYTKITRGPRKGNIRGFPLLLGSWCHRDLKIKPIIDYLKAKKEPYVQYVGIASDEPKRIDFEIKQGNKLPLVDYGITEKMAFDICKEHNMLSTAYEDFDRLGCWFCHKQNNKALAKVIEGYPDKYDKIISLDNDSAIKYRRTLTAKEFLQKIKGNK